MASKGERAPFPIDWQRGSGIGISTSLNETLCNVAAGGSLQLDIGSLTPRLDERARDRRVKLWRKHFAKVIRIDPAVGELIDELARREADEVVRMLDRGKPGWFPVRNLTDRLKALKAALEDKGTSHGRP